MLHVKKFCNVKYIRASYRQQNYHRSRPVDENVEKTKEELLIGEINFNLSLPKMSRLVTPPQCDSGDTVNEPNVRMSEGSTRFNQVDIQMLSSMVHQQIFGSDLQNQSSSNVYSLVEELKKFNLWQGDQVELLPDVAINLPKLEGRNIEEHFWHIGQQQSQPYKSLLLDLVRAKLPEPPSDWLCQAGWTRYVQGSNPEAVKYPDEDCLIFDIEVCCKLGQAPTLATAASPTAWYAWVSPLLPTNFDPVPFNQYSPDDFIPLEGRYLDKKKPRIVVGHNVSYDRARVAEQYKLESSALRFFDTMSMHVCIGGLTSYQRAMLKTKVPMEENDWAQYSSLNSLKEVYKLYCKEELSKETRNIFVDGDMNEIRNSFQLVMNYCSGDVIATQKILSKMLPLFFERFPHPVTLAGMLEMSTAYLPINSNWRKYLADSDQTFEDYQKESKFMLSRKSDNACRLQHNEQYKNHLWMWDEDWSTQELKITKKKVSVVDDAEVVDEDELPLYEKFQHLFQSAKQLPARMPHLPGYPLWYRKLCEKPNHPEWVPGSQLISTSVKVAPKILNLTWEGYPVFHTREHGWGILVADIKRKIDGVDVPFEQLKALTIERGFKENKSGGANNPVIDNLAVRVEENNSKGEFARRHGSNETSQQTMFDNIVDGCFFIKLPHKDGPPNNVGNPLAKDFIKTFTNSVLRGSDEVAEKVLDIARMLSYWRNNRERIIGQLAVWKDPELGAILPQVVVSGTLTRRAMEPTWMTASNALTQRVGSELRAMVQAPPGYHIVGADVDSQELWIASVLGDAAHAQTHGGTPFGRMTLIGTKANGTDMHSVTAKAAGISRDQAKVINYARIYGAGVRFAQRLLKQFNPTMSDSEAKTKATKMFQLTKGKKFYRLKDEFRDRLPDDIAEYHSPFSAGRVASTLGKNETEVFERPQWHGGTESAMFNRLEEIACSREPRTPFLSSRLSRAVEPRYPGDDSFMTTRVNWVVQSGAVDFLHLMLVSLRWLSDGKMRFCLSFHDEVRYLVPSHLRYEAALALHITNLLTRAFCSRRLGLHDLPMSVAFFGSVEVDKVIRKESGDDCVTPSNPHGLEKGYGIPPGESLDIYETIRKTNGRLSKLRPKRKSSTFLIAEMPRARRRREVRSEVTDSEPKPLEANQDIVRILASKGNNLHEVENSSGQALLARMDSKFRNTYWIKRGDYVLVEPVENVKDEDKVRVVIVLPLTMKYIEYLKTSKQWPDAFENVEDVSESDELWENPNRKNQPFQEDSSESSDDS